MLSTESSLQQQNKCCWESSKLLNHALNDWAQWSYTSWIILNIRNPVRICSTACDRWAKWLIPRIMKADSISYSMPVRCVPGSTAWIWSVKPWRFLYIGELLWTEVHVVYWRLQWHCKLGLSELVFLGKRLLGCQSPRWRLVQLHPLISLWPSLSLRLRWLCFRFFHDYCTVLESVRVF